MQRIEAMKWMQRLALLVVVVWNALFGLPLRAQETAGPSGPKPMVWNGEPPLFAPPIDTRDAANLAAALEKELARLKVALEVDGATEAQRKDLTRLWVIASRREEFSRRWEVLPRIVAGVAEELERRGEIRAAHFATIELLPRSQFAKELSQLFPSFTFVEASPELEKAAQAAAKDPKLVELRARLEKKLAQQPRPGNVGVRTEVTAADGQDENAAALLEDAVMRALLEQQPGMIRDLGARAAPALERLVVNDLDNLPPDAALDPLVLLLEVDEARGAQFALEHWPNGGYLFHKRVLRAMGKANVLSNSGTWLAASAVLDVPVFDPPRLVDTAWRDLLALAANDVEVRRDSLRLLQTLGEFDAFDAVLQRTLSGWIEQGPASDATSVLNMLLNCRGGASIVPIAESALASPRGETRVLAARILEQYARNDALRACTQDPEPEVRMAVARSFDGTITRVGYVAPSNTRGSLAFTPIGGSSAEYRRSIDARDSAFIEALLADTDARVRDLALKAFLESPDVTVSTERLVELAKDADGKVRQRLANWGRKEAVPPDVLLALASDTDPQTLDRAARELARATYDNARGVKVEWWSDAYLPALEALILNPGAPQNGVDQAAWRAGRSEAGAKLLMRLARTAWSPRTFAMLVVAMTGPKPPFDWDAIGVDELPMLLRERFSADQKESWRNLMASLPDAHAAAFRSLLLDATIAPEVRLEAAAASAATADDEWNRAFADVVVALPADFWAREAWWPDSLRQRLGKGERSERLIVELARRQGPIESLGRVIQQLGSNFRLPEDVALVVLGRHVETQNSSWRSVQGSALLSLVLTDAEPRTELIERFLMDRSLQGTAVTAISRFHLDAHLPLLERAVLGEFDDGGQSPLVAAAQVLAGYLDERAAEILLKAIAATSNQSQRDVFFKALDEIRRYQDERERWANRKSSKAARDAAIAELVPMLADKDATIRAQAARSLGALEALEQLPALVRLLKDSNDGVRKAAQSAIDVLTAPKPVPPAPEAPKSGAPAKKDE